MIAAVIPAVPHSQKGVEELHARPWQREVAVELWSHHELSTEVTRPNRLTDFDAARPQQSLLLRAVKHVAVPLHPTGASSDHGAPLLSVRHYLTIHRNESVPGQVSEVDWGA